MIADGAYSWCTPFCAKAFISSLLDVTAWCEVMPIVLLVWCSEIQPLEVRAAACSFNVAMNMLFTFVIGQCFVTMLCHMEWGVFLFFAGELPSLCALHLECTVPCGVV